MTKYTGRFTMPIVVGAFALLAACSGDKNKADTALAADTTLNRDLALAGKDTAAQPQLTDVPATSGAKAPAGGRAGATKTTTRTKTTTTKTATKTASGNTVTKGTGTTSRAGSIPAGSTINAHANSEICTNTSKVGDKLAATVTESVVGSNGAAIPAGATLHLTVTRLKRSENMNDPIVMEFAVNSVEFGGKTYAVEASLSHADVARVRNEPKSADVKKVVGGAAIGAIAGRVLGKSTKSPVIGAAAGAAAGAGAAAATANYEGCVRAGGNLVVTLSAPISVTT